MKDKEKQIEEMAMIMCENNCEECRRESIEFYGNSYDEDTQCLFNVGAERLYNADYRKTPKDSVVVSREEYKELINLQRTHAEDLTNAIQSYEESKADLKLEYDNHIKNLEKIIDRQSKDLNSQANRLIDLKAELENKGKETAEKFANFIKSKLFDLGNIVNERDINDMLKEFLCTI